MKNSPRYEIEIMIICVAIALLWSSCKPNRILKHNTDDRGLTSIQYIDPNNGNDTFALDYLTKSELDSVSRAINR